MRKFLSVIAVVVMAAVILVGGNGGVVSAQSAGLGISPRKDLIVQPGKTITDKLQIINLNNEEDLFLTLQIIDFGAKDETGTPALQLNPNAPQTAWSLKPFITAPKELTVMAGKTEYVNFSVNIPAGQGAGSYYSAIRYVAEGTEQGNVAVSASGATLVFVTVPGKTKESLILQKFGAFSSDGKGGGSYKSVFVSGQPKELAFTVKNQGNVAEQPTGSIQIKNIFGKRVQLVRDANPKSSLALIDQARRFETCIIQPDKDAEDTSCKNSGFAPGRYTAELSLFYGINGNSTQELVGSASFWYLPAWFLALIEIIVGAIALGGFIVYRRFTGKGSFKRR